MYCIWRPHVTVAAVVERGGRFLLVEERVDGAVRINQPAGHLEFGETLAQAVARETLEETRHDFTPHALIGAYLLPTGPDASSITYLRMAFTGTLGAEHSERPLEDGIERILWLTREEIAARGALMRSPLVLRCVDDYLAGRRAGLDLLHYVS
jgi:8-oxo-dGTP pyrophosphatase MutT (NUDIX family)